MALAGTRNAKALAWNSGSLEREAQSSRSGARWGAGTQRGETGREGQREPHTGTDTQRDKAEAEQGEVIEATGRSLTFLGTKEENK